MKRAVKALFIAVYFAALIYAFIYVKFLTYDVDVQHMDIYFGKVPEGTAFADILMKDSSDELRLNVDTDTNCSYYVLSVKVPDLDIDENSEIVRYNEDGYRSLMFTRNDYGAVFLEELQIASGKADDHICFGGYTQPILKHFHHIKVAYCDKEGNILGITNEVKVKRVPLYNIEYEIKADSNDLSCKVVLARQYYVIAVFLLSVILLAVSVIVKIKRKAAQKAQSAKATENAD